MRRVLGKKTGWLLIVAVCSMGAISVGGVSMRPMMLHLADVFQVGDSSAVPVGPVTTSLANFQSGDAAGALGHPMFMGAVPDPLGDPLPVEPPAELVSGAFVNFESPMVKPIALSQNGELLYAVNTPNNSLTVLSTQGGSLSRLTEIPVGLDPVSVMSLTPNVVLVANYISDDVSVVDVSAGKVIEVIPVGDSPVNLLADDSGQFVFVITEGPNNAQLENIDPQTSDLPEGAVVTIRTSDWQVVNELQLPCNTPRAAAYRNGKLYVAALFSGNNTTVVGESVFFNLVPPLPNIAPFVPALWIAQFYSGTATLFGASAELSPWPDPENSPNHSVPSPFVHRIVPDSAKPGDWNLIVDILSDGNGDPDPVVVAEFTDEFETFVETAFGIPEVFLLNAEAMIEATIDDVKDTADQDVLIIDATDPANMTLTNSTIVGNVGTTLTGMAANPTNDVVYVSNLEARNLTRLEPELNGHFIDHQIIFLDDSVDPVGKRVKDLHANVVNFNDTSAVNALAQSMSLSHPTDLVCSPDGTRLYVAASGVSRVGVLDAGTGTVLGRIDVGRGPRGLALDGALDLLYVLNRTDMSIDIIDVSSDTMSAAGHFDLFNPEPAVIRDGRDFLYSTRFSNNYGSSCAMCHSGAGFDALAWDLGNPEGDLQPGPPNLVNGNGEPLLNHPVKGPMVTLSLKGLDRHLPLHWRADKPLFQDFNGAFEALLGGSELTPAQMDAYTDFIMTVVYPPSFYRDRDNSFKDDRAWTGLAQFIGDGIPPEQQTCANCNTCHQVAHDGAMLVEQVEGDAGFNLSGGLFAQLQLVTQLRGIDKKVPLPLYSGFGTVHDGREERLSTDNPLMTFLETFFNGFSDELKHGMVAYTQAFSSNVMPVVGWQIFLDGIVEAAQSDGIDLMIEQSDMNPSRCDVVAHGVIFGQQRGYYMIQANPPIFQSDIDETHTLVEMFGWISLSSSNSLRFLAVPPGSGRRIGIDQDMDCFSNGLDPNPQLNLAGDQDGNGAVNLVDFLTFSGCFTGGGATIDPLSDCGCRADLNKDGVVDLVDFLTFSGNFIG